jgi:glucosamine--fructose-6-phosphate aminotransferase (isomerizing)
MCGIVGAVAKRDVVPFLLEGLKRLEYRGYDSAGIAVVNGKLQRLRSTGRVATLGRLVDEKSLHGNIGIAHTRWATHGAPSEANAHPHVSGGISVVHNGIIENHEEMRRKLKELGYIFVSETDSEVIAHLIHSYTRTGASLFAAVRKSVAELQGAFAIAVINENDKNRMAVARMGAPLLLGLGDNENFAASDTSALLQVTQKVIYLEEGDCAEVTREGVKIVSSKGATIERPLHRSTLSPESVELGTYKHYMQKEIFEQPRAVADTLELATRTRTLPAELFGADAPKILAEIDSVLIVACGTSSHAGLVARHWIEGLAGIPCNVEIASEYRYRQSVPNPKQLVVAISQSGETADTLAALGHARALGQPHSLAICNVAESAIVRATALRFLTRAGPEIGVASTKAFTTQLVALVLLAIYMARAKSTLSPGAARALLRDLADVPRLGEELLARADGLREVASRLEGCTSVLYLGRGIQYPLALEGALKLKEVSYIATDAYAAGEMKHGPIALIDPTVPVVVVAPQGRLYEKTLSNIEEVKARDGRVIALASEDDREIAGKADQVFRLPRTSELLLPILTAMPLQLLAYHAAVVRGRDVDQPRNLAKSVTVE